MATKGCDSCGAAQIVSVTKSNGYTHFHTYQATMEGQEFCGPHIWLNKDGRESYDECTVNFRLCSHCGKMQGAFPLPETTAVAHFPMQ